MTDDELAAVFAAAVDQLDAARRAAQAEPTDKLLRLEQRLAGERVREMRRLWRNIGAAVGDRAVRDGQATTGVAVVNGDGSRDGTAIRNTGGR